MQVIGMGSSTNNKKRARTYKFFFSSSLVFCEAIHNLPLCVPSALGSRVHPSRTTQDTHATISSGKASFVHSSHGTLSIKLPSHVLFIIGIRILLSSTLHALSQQFSAQIITFSSIIITKAPLVPSQSKSPKLNPIPQFYIRPYYPHSFAY